MKNENRLFSVIIPTYARPRQLGRCLCALSRLQFPRDQFEVLVVDDGSPIDTEPAIRPFRTAMNVRLIRQANAGPSAARNRGAALARGRFLAFTDDDCAVDPGWLKAFSDQFAVRENQLLGGHTVNALRQNLCATASQLILDVVHEHFNQESDPYRFFASNNMSIPAEGYRQIEGFDSRFRTSEDRDFCDRWRAGGGQLTYVPAATMHHAHEMGLAKFLRQHFAYGRGAWRFHRARHQRGTGKFEVEGSFYGHCFQSAAARGGQSAGLLAMMCFWQLANTAGFFCEAIADLPRSIGGKEHSIKLRLRQETRSSPAERGSIRFLPSAAPTERRYRVG